MSLACPAFVDCSKYFLFLLLTYTVSSSDWLTACSWVHLERSPVLQLLKNFPAFSGTQRFISTFTRALHLSLSWSRPSHSTPTPSYHSYYCYPPTYILASSPLAFRSTTYIPFLFCPICATCPANLGLLDLIILIIQGVSQKVLRLLKLV
jgi:hypothetical protein